MRLLDQSPEKQNSLFYPPEVLQAPCIGQDLEDFLLHFIDVLWSVTHSGHNAPDFHHPSVHPAKIAVVGPPPSLIGRRQFSRS